MRIISPILVLPALIGIVIYYRKSFKNEEHGIKFYFGITVIIILIGYLGYIGFYLGQRV